MKQPVIKLAQSVIQACKSKGIKDIIISPGSRNAPLTIGFSNDSYFNCYSIVDERCAAFFALGMGQQLQKPVAVVCTSGSAVLNYYPAFCEAFYSNIPMVVISADRPSSKIDIGDGQTIRQMNVFANHSGYNANLSDEDFSQKSNDYELNQALNTAIAHKMPVHINVPFEEPLYLTTEEVYQFDNQPLTILKPILEEEKITDFITHWNASKKKLVLVGVLQPNSLEINHLEKLATDPSVLILTETTSNLHHKNIIAGIDKLLNYLEKDNSFLENFRPELLLTFGGLVVSKKIKQFLRKFQPKFHYHIDLYKGYDSYFCLTHHFKTDINSFFDKVEEKIIPQPSLYQANHLEINALIKEKHLLYSTKTPYSDFKIYAEIFRSIPEKTSVQLSNSSTVRYAQLFDFQPLTEVFCNRGTSGIDGSVSTAIGAAVAVEKQMILITGDLSFFYDSNALWNKYIPKNFRILLINNQGGGIFRILPGDKSDKNFETFFETPHQLTAEHLCKMYMIDYQSVTNSEDLKKNLKTFFDISDKPKLLEIHTPRTKNDIVLAAYFKFLKE